MRFLPSSPPPAPLRAPFNSAAEFDLPRRPVIPANREPRLIHILGQRPFSNVNF